MFKKLSKYITGITTFLAIKGIAFADKVNIDELIPQAGEKPEQWPELTVVNDLPDVSHTEFFAGVIRTILGWSMVLTIAGIVMVGIFYMHSQGNEEQLNKAKEMIIYLIVGLVIMASAYALIMGIAQFDFFT